MELFVRENLAKYGMHEIQVLIEDLSKEEGNGGDKEKLQNLYMDLESIFSDKRFMKEYEFILEKNKLKDKFNGLEEENQSIKKNMEFEFEELKVEYLPPKCIDWIGLLENNIEDEAEILKIIQKVKKGEIGKYLLDSNSSNKIENERNACFMTELEYVPEGIRNYIYKHGISQLRQGKVAVVIMSGGDGSRLGYNGPKGMYPIGKISKDSFFKIFCQKIQSLTRIVIDEDSEFERIPLYIMTSENNHSIIRRYFEENKNFGLKNVCFFKQDSIPSINIKNNYSFFLSKDLRIIKSPNGNGGIFHCMKEQGIINDMNNKGIEYVFINCIDNPLCKICDPFFIGYTDLLNLQVSTKTINKKDANENIGSIAQKFIKEDSNLQKISPCIIEYTELNKLGNKKDHFPFGSIGIHLFRLDFIQEISNKIFEFPYHIANKKIPYLKYLNDQDNNSYLKLFIEKPSEINGIKLETFIFDSFTFTSAPIHCINVSRDEFSPVKSISGQDSPDTCQNAISNFNKKLLKHALKSSNQISEDFLLSSSNYLEISPLVSYNGENLNKFSQMFNTPNNHKFIYINDNSQVIFQN